MTGRTWLTVAFAAACLAQIAVPVSMILSHERTLVEGVIHRFECAPVDPADPFRGRYVALSFVERSVETGDRPAPGPGTWIFVGLRRDAEGFTALADWTREAPAGGDYLRVQVHREHDGEIFLNLPFDRFYLAEGDAPAAEQAYRERVGTGEPDGQTWVEVRVRDGRAVIAELYLGGVPVRELLASGSARPSG